MPQPWPAFDVARDHPTLHLLHLASQMLGKMRVAHSTWTNHGWNVTLHPVAEGLAIEPIVINGLAFTLTLDLCRHAIVLSAADGERDILPLDLGSVAALHRNLIAMLDAHGFPSTFNGLPNEIEGAVPFAEDTAPRDYRPDTAERLHAALMLIEPVFERFRAGFAGKCSPVHFFWGSFDLAVTRFSGNRAPTHPGGVPGLPDRITHEAYSHEVSSAGFWPGGAIAAEPIFYSYAYPEPDGFRARPVAPDAALFDGQLGEFVLPYDAVRTAKHPEAALMAFLESTYAAAADLAGWDRPSLERDPVAP
ncbi:hypothetical protein H9L12_11850 [Sphingomonas rhizophila]|uniref:Ava_C0101 and related proteins n=1 Tax=Sphingomonas rhizophila TaxID=2071607 RepID=A0A7G9SAM7_9SPHN|nr:DUF5996 family protein [Sphingomonas rhizophila]QNN64902.1 hypothetical protein H9L12_11850 [Sphingomonas rhizophila]